MFFSILQRQAAHTTLFWSGVEDSGLGVWGGYSVRVLAILRPLHHERMQCLWWTDVSRMQSGIGVLPLYPHGSVPLDP